MRPMGEKASRKGKGPANRVARKRPVEEVTSSEEDQDLIVDNTLIHNESSLDSDSSWEIDPDVTMAAVADDEEVEGYQLPRELAEPDSTPLVLDSNSEDDDDHTGVWQKGDLESLVGALNHYRPKLKGKFFGCAGGKARKDKAWRDVAEYVNERCSVHWSVQQCKGKARRFALVVKKKFNALKRELFKTGGGEVDDDAYLTQIEESMLDYVGVEGVVGLKGMHGSRLKPYHGKEHRELMNHAAVAAWDPERPDRRSYLNLDHSKVKLVKKSKVASKTKVVRKKKQVKE